MKKVKYNKGRFHFLVEVNGSEYWGNYTPAPYYDFYLNSDYGLLGHTEDEKVIGTWNYEEVRRLAQLGKLPVVETGGKMNAGI